MAETARPVWGLGFVFAASRRPRLMDHRRFGCEHEGCNADRQDAIRRSFPSTASRSLRTKSQRRWASFADRAEG